MEIRALNVRQDLEQLSDLINVHIGTLVPGWELPGEFIGSRLARDPSEYVTDPWIDVRRTLVGYDNGRLCAAIHLQQYADDSPAEGRWDIKWFVCWPDHKDVGAALLDVACSELHETGTEQVLLSQNLYIPTCPPRLPDCWPHIRSLVEAKGLVLADPDNVETVYGGMISASGEAVTPPFEGLRLVRRTGRFGTKFVAVYDDEEIAFCECVTDLIKGGRLPSMAGWADLAEVEVDEAWRNKGIGTWLIGHVIDWLQLGGFTRLIVCVLQEDDLNGAGRFYGRFGLRPLFQVQGTYVFDMSR